MLERLIKCTHNNNQHKNCFARTENGRCSCLNDCNFKDGKCHFYKEKNCK